MGENIVWWAWIIVGGLFLLVELTTTTFFGLWMAIAALVPALTALIWPHFSLQWQLTLWIVAMLLCGWLWSRYNRKYLSPVAQEDSLAGQIGVLARECSASRPGLLLLQKPVMGASEWRCISDEPLPADTRVVVVAQPEPYLVRVERTQSIHQKTGGA
ncbi:hypothetical protein BL250_17065 [Erwinia sp. OLTSP20]|uniref:NfeD family protein n=1 Tax=unclassified Erwinia TaxID=2622719 RepID=UPI000C1A7525|nr:MULTISPECIES: NfeD family protein [unclassified Erwinia]PIJ49037.1 hypothetical protein BV501_15140 [Erwinia sp. OAMSP11]PIJ75031.1 hypothetical protein BK416_02760 [Erwinia sp. OLSSP12]PIJ79722.1 hypothetical protein BLD47_13765 [Erwinia sp. OLCASP19]PIJ80507.1 hypothetical protein BLD46_15610 [Erwinia sp. OLMTSP26]PIJ82622.1 hypothetical protein BLD49_15505 [Erwinia sp. OLMDSP33]